MGTHGAIEQRILDSLGWGVMVVGRWSRTILQFSRPMEELTGVAATDAVGRTVSAVFGHIEGVDLEPFEAQIQTTGRLESTSVRFVRPDGSVVYRNIRGDVLAGGPGEEEAVVVSLQDVTEQEWTRRCFSRYVTKDVVDRLARDRIERLRGEEVEVAVLVADMRNFTAAAEGLTPEELFETVNAYLEPMVEVVLRHRGCIDKFTGDGFMAVFGAPSSSGDEAGRALAAALELRTEVGSLSRRREEAGLPSVGLGYAIHWGPALAGTLGSPSRMEYTVIGDTVNLAHRLQALAGPGDVYATAAASRAAGNGYEWTSGWWVRLRGRRAPVKVFSLLGRSGEA